MKCRSFLGLLGLAALLAGCEFESREDLCQHATRLEAAIKACAADSSCRSTSDDYYWVQRYRRRCEGATL